MASERQIKHDVLHLVGCRALDHQGQIGYCRTDLQAVRNDDHAWHGLTGLHTFEGVFGNCVHVVRNENESLLATRGQ